MIFVHENKKLPVAGESAPGVQERKETAYAQPDNDTAIETLTQVNRARYTSIAKAWQVGFGRYER